MKIVHVDSASSWRGGQHQVLLCARGLIAGGHSVALACQAGGALAQRARGAGLEVHELRFGGDLSPRAWLGLRRLLDRTRAQIVHLHDSHALAAGALATRGVPRVATRRVDFRLHGPLARWKYTRCARVIAVSAVIARLLEADGVPAARLRIVPDGVADRPPQPGGAAALAELGIPAGVPVVGSVAALVDHKDHATLLEAAARVGRSLPDVRFVIVGEGALRQSLEARAAAPDLKGRVIFTGFRNDVDRLIPAFDVFCLSSHHEGLGSSLLDAMCFGRPVVATAAGGIGEVVIDGRTGRLVELRNPDALAAALLDLIQDRSARAALGAAGRQRFLEHFTAERMVEGTLAVYRELL